MSAPTPPGASSRTIDVLLATFNGAAYLDQQVESILAQRGVRVRLLVRDDGSTDGTPSIVRRHVDRRPDSIALVEGPAFGNPAANFLALLAESVRGGRADWIAFADQDDVWLPDKLARAIAALHALPQDEPALYGSATTLVDADGRVTGRSPHFRRPPAFANALVQNIAAGNTMVMNRAAAALVDAAGTPALRLHDGWCYQLVTGAGGTMVYDDEPSLLYRQHGANAIGAGAGWPARFRRWTRVMNGGFAQTNRAVVSELSSREAVLTADARRCLGAYREACRAPTAGRRLRALAASGVYRQTPAQNTLLKAACALGKL